MIRNTGLPNGGFRLFVAAPPAIPVASHLPVAGALASGRARVDWAHSGTPMSEEET